MRGAGARSRVRLEAMPGATLYYSSGITILQQGSTLNQELDVVLQPGASVAYLEVLALGRFAHGEHLAFRRFTGAIHVRSPERGLLYEVAC